MAIMIMAAPVLAALSAFAARVMKYTISVESVGKTTEKRQ